MNIWKNGKDRSTVLWDPATIRLKGRFLLQAVHTSSRTPVSFPVQLFINWCKQATPLFFMRFLYLVIYFLKNSEHFSKFWLWESFNWGKKYLVGYRTPKSRRAPVLFSKIRPYFICRISTPPRRLSNVKLSLNRVFPKRERGSWQIKTPAHSNRLLSSFLKYLLCYLISNQKKKKRLKILAHCSITGFKICSTYIVVGDVQRNCVWR